MKPIKLIVKYYYQEWNGYSYIYPEHVEILEFNNIEEITRDSIFKALREKHDKYHIDISDIKQIIN